MADARNIKVKISVPDTAGNIYLQVQKRRHIYLIFKEAINNAVKYSGASLLKLDINATGHSMEVIISDDGKGFDTDTVKKGNGLINMQSRADEIGAEFIMQSAPDKGTTICIRCKFT
jgi:signal transduction histidine kinase